MIIVPISRTLAQILYVHADVQLIGKFNYFYIRYDTDGFGIVSDVIAKNRYWAFEHDYYQNSHRWIPLNYKSDYVLQSCDFDTQYGSHFYVWRNGRLDGEACNNASFEVNTSPCDWIQPVVSILTSFNANEYRKLAQYLTDKNWSIVSNKLGGLKLSKVEDGQDKRLSLFMLLFNSYW